MRKQIAIESTLDVDESMTCTTLPQLGASGNKNALFQIKVQVKDRKVNSLFERGSQRNLIFEILVNELGLETHDLV